MDKASLYYGAVTCGICFILPWIFIIVGLIVIHRLIAAEKRKEKKELRGTNASQKLWADPGIERYRKHSTAQISIKSGIQYLYSIL